MPLENGVSPNEVPARSKQIHGSANKVIIPKALGLRRKWMQGNSPEAAKNGRQVSKIPC
jgi:hypothetical protein